MIESLREKRLSTTMLCHFVLVNLLYPVYTSGVGTPYSPDFILANLFAVIFIAAAVLEGNLQWKKRDLLVWSIVISMIGFNLFAFYANWSFFGWYAGQINVTISFAFFAALLISKDSARFNGRKFVQFLLGAVVITTMIGFIPKFMGYVGSTFSEGILHFYTGAEGGENRYSWIYEHKSEYSFMLVLFLSLVVTYRCLFEKKWMFYCSVAVFIMGLFLANTRTTMLAATFVFAGAVMDYLVKKSGGFRLRYLCCVIPVAAVALVILKISRGDRDVFTLGMRTYIWKGAVEHILDNPWGIGAMCGLQNISVEKVPAGVWNCHNVFLNYFLQFSIPAGFFYLVSMGAIMIASIMRRPSFKTLGIWIALLIPMNMDWCVLLPQVPMLLLVLWVLFFAPCGLTRDFVDK